MRRGVGAASALRGLPAAFVSSLAACVLLLGVAGPAAAQSPGDGFAGTWEMRSEVPGLAGELRVEPDGRYRLGMITGRLAPAEPGFDHPPTAEFRELRVFGRVFFATGPSVGRLAVYSPEGELVASGSMQRAASAANPLGVAWVGVGATQGAEPAPAVTGSARSPETGWAGAAPASPGAPPPAGGGLDVEWRTGGGTAATVPPPPAGSTTPPATSPGLGVEWRTGAGTAGTSPPPGGGLGVEWAGAGGGTPAPPPGGGLGVEWAGAGSGTPPPPSGGGGLGVEWKSGPPTGGAVPPPVSPGDPKPGPPGGSTPPPVTPPGPGPGPEPEPVTPPPPVEAGPGDGPPGQDPPPAGGDVVCTTPEPPETPAVPDPTDHHLRGLLPSQVGEFRSGFWKGYLDSWTSLRTGQPAPQRPVHGPGQATTGAYNTGWAEGMSKASWDWRTWKVQHPPVCRPKGAAEDPNAPLVGVWAYEAVYFPSTGTSVAGNDVSGSLALNADGTYSQNLGIGRTYPTLIPDPRTSDVARYRVEGGRMTMEYVWGASRANKADVYEIALAGDLLTLRGAQAVYTLRRAGR